MKLLFAAAMGVGLVASWAVWKPSEVSASDHCPRQDEPKYEGSKSCQKCHFQEYGSWQKTKMALAFKSLKPG
jgi:hypothetical protein